MFDLTLFDYIYVGVILLSTVWATIRGGVYETMATLAWIAAAVAARFVSPWLDGLFQSWFGLAESTIGSLVAAYFIVFFVILVCFSFINQKIRDKVQGSILKVTDHTLGVVFGIIRGIGVMGLLYWGTLWYYGRGALPDWIAAARTRPVMQLTAVKIHQWFIPGESKLLERDVLSSAAAQEIYDNLINPAVKTVTGKNADDLGLNPSTDVDLPTAPDDVGYRDTERQSLENQLLQLEAKAEADEKAAAEMEKRRKEREANAAREEAEKAAVAAAESSANDATAAPATNEYGTVPDASAE